MVRLWTIQADSVRRELEERGRVRVDPGRRDGPAPKAYRWLAERLHRVIPGYAGGLPFWLHTHEPRAAWSSGAARDGEVVLELCVPRERCFVLRSWAWTRVVDGAYLALSRAEHRAWRRDLRALGLREADLMSWFEPEPEPLPEPLEARRGASFERLFDPKLPARPWRHAGRHGFGHPRGTEAVVEELERDWLLGVRGSA